MQIYQWPLQAGINFDDPLP